MDRRLTTGTLTGTALLLAMGVVLPIVFHAFPLGGRIFLPMHLPVLVAGLVLGPVAGLIVGAGSPIVSMLITGRPTVPFMVPMLLELAAYGVVAGLVRAKLDAARPAAGEGAAAAAASMRSIWVALLSAMVVGRAVWVAAVVWLVPLVGINARSAAAAMAALGAGWAGIVIQLILLPPIVRAIERLRTPRPMPAG